MIGEHLTTSRRQLLRALRWSINLRTGPVPRAGLMMAVVARALRSRSGLQTLPSDLIRTAVTTPPYFGHSFVDEARRRRLILRRREAARKRLARWLSGGSAAIPDAGLTLALIADEALADEATGRGAVVPVRPEDWRIVLAGLLPPADLLVVESADRGNDGAWMYRLARYGHADSLLLADLRELVGWCQARGMATVFFDTASDGSIERFRDAAALFDVILTRSAVAAARYRDLDDHRAWRVEALGPRAGLAEAVTAARALAAEAGEQAVLRATAA